MISSASASTADASSAARLFGIDPAFIDAVGGGFSGASVFRVQCRTGDTFAVRCTPVESSSLDDRHEEFTRLIGDLSRRGLSFLATSRTQSTVTLPSGAWTPIVTETQNAAARTRVQIGPCFWQAETWLPGAPVSGFPTNAQVLSTARALAIFYREAHRCVKEQPEQTWLKVTHGASPGVERRLRIVRELAAGQLDAFQQQLVHDSDSEFRRLAIHVCNVVHRRLPALTARLIGHAVESFPLQPVIRDLWRAHVLFTDESLTGLIDLSSMDTDHYGFDISRLFRSWFGPDNAAILQAVEMFAEHVPVNVRDRHLFRTLDAATVLLSPMTWIRRRIDSGSRDIVPSDTMTRFRELVELAHAFQELT